MLKMQYYFKLHHMNPTEKATAEIGPSEIISSERNIVDGTKERKSRIRGFAIFQLQSIYRELCMCVGGAGKFKTLVESIFRLE